MLRMIPIARRDGPGPVRTSQRPPTRIEGVIEFPLAWIQARERIAQDVHDDYDPDYGDDPEPPPELLANWSWNHRASAYGDDGGSWHGSANGFGFRFWDQTVMFIFRGGQTGACKIDYIDEALAALGWERV